LTRALESGGSMRFLMMLGVIAVVVGFFIFFTTRLTTPPMSLLYSDLEPSDASKIVAKLDGMGVSYELRAGGSSVFVASDKALRLRMAMAEDSLPRGGSVGYEVFDRSDALGATRTMQNINMLRALEGELARTIRSISGISAARVHLVLPKRELFTREQRKPSASIIIAMATSDPLGRGQVAAIQHLVAAAVPGLTSSRVSIVDDRGTLLARGGGEDAGSAIAGVTAQEYRLALETRIKHMIEGIVERSVGFGKVRAEVTADIDFARVTTTSENFDPDSQVARSTQLVEETTSSSRPEGTGTASVGERLPGAATDELLAPTAEDATARTEQTTNFEISKTVRNHVLESGTVKRLSVAVLIDGTYSANEDGERIYQPRPAEEMAQITALVRSAIGYDADRGDTVEVINMEFTPIEAPEMVEAPAIDLGKGDYFKIAEIAVFFIVGLFVVFLVLRPLASRAFEVRPARLGDDAPAALPQPAEATAQLANQEEAEEEESGIDIEHIEGRVKDSSIRKIGEIVESHPEEALAIIRNWLYQEA
jgi:flagellar M-ring protein FliF